MKKFKYSFSSALKTLLILATAITLIGAGLNVYNIIALNNLQAINYVGYVALVAVNLFIATTCVTVFAFSAYYVKDGKLVVAFGYIKTKIPLEDITEIINFLKEKKLVIYFSENKYSVVLISENSYADFISVLTKANPNITYTVRGETESKN